VRLYCGSDIEQSRFGVRCCCSRECADLGVAEATGCEGLVDLRQFGKPARDPHLFTRGGQPDAATIVQPVGGGETAFFEVAVCFIELCDEGEQLMSGEVYLCIQSADFIA